MILSPDEDLQQTARQANPDEKMVVIAWPNPLKSKNAQKGQCLKGPMAEPITRTNERTEDIMLMTILAMILNY